MLEKLGIIKIDFFHQRNEYKMLHSTEDFIYRFNTSVFFVFADSAFFVIFYVIDQFNSNFQLIASTLPPQLITQSPHFAC